MVTFENGDRKAIVWQAGSEVWLAVDGKEPVKLASFFSNERYAAHYLEGIGDFLSAMKMEKMI